MFKGKIEVWLIWGLVTILLMHYWSVTEDFNNAFIIGILFANA